MFGIIHVDGRCLAYDFYMIDPDDGSHALYDKLRIRKTTVPGMSGLMLKVVDNESHRR
jgi:hypothetical protein